MKRVKIVPRAQSDMRELEAWIAGRRPAAAVLYLQGLNAVFRHLAEWPMSGRARGEIRPELRSFVHRNHVVFYRATRHGISVLRVIHAKRDLARVFN